MEGGGYRIQIPLLAGHQRPASETPFKWRFAGGPMMAQYWMLDWYLCDFKGIRGTLYFCNFPGGRGPDPLDPHMETQQCSVKCELKLTMFFPKPVSLFSCQVYWFGLLEEEKNWSEEKESTSGKTRTINLWKSTNNQPYSNCHAPNFTYICVNSIFSCSYNWLAFTHNLLEMIK